ncbi:uncharacterized protein LOC134172656 [Pezoporus occidentalis]|uniref:uncharacterized protein LOC134172656 n=1 Tax=Pezoporus occidentalis TaxID=407982 RepID=UPI002F910426
MGLGWIRDGAGSGVEPVEPRSRSHPQCGSERFSRRGGGASGSGPTLRPRPRPAHGPALRTVSRPMVVTLGPERGGATGAPPLPFPPPPSVLRLPPPPQQRDRPRPPPADPQVPPGVVAAVSFGAFVVGAALAGGVWFVHGRTAAPRPPPAPPRSNAAPQCQLRSPPLKPPPVGAPPTAP